MKEKSKVYKDPVEYLMAEEQAWEQGNTTTDFIRLQRAGIHLPPPEDLNDKELGAKLWEVIEALAELRTFLEFTNHLSDRELYAYLWNHALREEVADIEPYDKGNTILSILGGCSEEDNHNYLKYYADEQDREHWSREFPDYTMPEHEDPLFDRDRHLP